jgi:hypothetical protein
MVPWEDQIILVPLIFCSSNQYLYNYHVSRFNADLPVGDAANVDALELISAMMVDSLTANGKSDKNIDSIVAAWAARQCEQRANLSKLTDAEYDDARGLKMCV